MALPLISSAAALTLMDQQPPAIAITAPPLDDDASSSAPPSPCSVVSDCSTADLDGFPDPAASALALDDLLPVADTAQQQRVTAARSVFALDCVPRWGLESVCGRRPEMEDAALILPRFFQLPLWMLAGDAAVDGLDPASFHLPAHFFAVFDGHGGVQVPLLSRLSPHAYDACRPI
jgi:protein phosphatase 2C